MPLVDGKYICRCGKEARPGQRNCYDCCRATVRGVRARKRVAEARLQQALQRLTVDFPATRSLYESRFETRAVVIPSEDGRCDVTGLVVGFLPDLMLKVLDDFGAIHIVQIDRVVEDCGKRVYGGESKTQFYAPDPSGDQGSVAA